MKTTARLTAAVVAAALVTFVVAGAVLAASPAPTDVPTVGGTLSAAGKTIEVYSNGNVPAHVTMSATDVTLSETEFDLLPGETHTLTFSGAKATGTVSALYTTIARFANGESGSAKLTLALAPFKAPPVNLLPYVLVGLLVALALVLALRRLRPWEWRITRKATA